MIIDGSRYVIVLFRLQPMPSAIGKGGVASGLVDRLNKKTDQPLSRSWLDNIDGSELLYIYYGKQLLQVNDLGSSAAAIYHYFRLCISNSA